MSINRAIRFRILARDNFTCRYCGAKAPDVALQIDHIMPRSQGGADAWDNLITACFDCNQGKKDAILSEEQMATLRPTSPPMPLSRRRKQIPTMPVQVRLPEPEPEPVAVVLPAPPVVFSEELSGLIVLLDCEGCGSIIHEDEYDANDGYCNQCVANFGKAWCALCGILLPDDLNDTVCSYCEADQAHKENELRRRRVSAWRTDGGGLWANRTFRHGYRQKMVTAGRAST